ncbi:MAG TPA: hypothetical protein VLU46_03605, partial [Thermoanaerobaculia bacterium]|nr:hypothetical protein [Thermoanaerobaculia bacterium]
MKRAIAFVVGLVAAAAIVWLLGNHAFSGARVERPPDARRTFPDHEENASAARVLASVTRFDEKDLRQQREAEIEYIRTRIASELPAAPPESLARFFERNRAAISMLRAQLASDAPPQWKQHADDLLETPQPDLIVMNRLLLMFAAHALAERDATTAWADAGAMWVLARSLWVRPEIPSVLTALGGSRQIAAVATKLPAPAPRWWNDFTTFDVRAALARALEYEAWATNTRAERYPVG